MQVVVLLSTDSYGRRVICFRTIAFGLGLRHLASFANRDVKAVMETKASFMSNKLHA